MDANLPERIRLRVAPEAAELSLSNGMPVVLLQPAQWLVAVRTLRDEFALRFEVVVHLYSTRERVRIRLKTRVPETDPVVDSLVSLYGSAAFMERECHDMFGVRFRGNDDLRPILLYEGFNGHPLRKDYPKHQEQPLVQYRDNSRDA
jgi:NADH-quinone oxidoreductase subunit C